MIGSFQTGVSGLQQFQQELEVIGNNIANVNTAGYKGSHVEFADTFSQSLLNGANVLQVGTGVATAAINSSFTQGTINTTGTTTDLAISGSGYFLVRDTSSNTTYATRDGQFTLDQNGYLQTNAGMRVQGYTGAPPYTSATPTADILIDAASAIAAFDPTAPVGTKIANFSIDSFGQVNARLDDGVNGVMAQVVLQDFTNPQALMKLGNNVYTWDTNAGPLAAPAAPRSGGLGQIYSGAIETSNVDLSTEMTSMITAQRAFEANAKIVTTSDEILQTLVNLKR
ncbi:MAG: flagellar hook-basal body complex protein [Verrucomicrobiota bacterium]